MFSAPKVKRPPPPPNTPVAANASSVEAGQIAGGRLGPATLLTSPQGLLTPATTERKTLLGG